LEEDRLLNEEEQAMLKQSHKYLVDFIKVDVLVPKLVDASAINLKHESWINTGRNVYERRRYFLEILKRRSSIEYKAFLDCLHSVDQSDVVEILECKGGTSYQPLKSITLLLVHDRFLNNSHGK